MRLTTKIVAGIILSIFVISIAFIISLSFTDWKKHSYSNYTVNNVELPQDNITGIELASFKTIIINEVPYDSQGRKFQVISNSNIYFDPLPEKDNPDMLFVPESIKEYAAINTSADTLTIMLDINGLVDRYKPDNSNRNNILGINLRFSVSNIDIINQMQDLTINLKNIEIDNMMINSHGDILIDSCKAQLLIPFIHNSYKSFHMTNSIVKRVNLDMDQMPNWRAENCKIEEENMTGSGTFTTTRDRKEAGNINWIPKNKDAELNIKIQGDTAQIIIR